MQFSEFGKLSVPSTHFGDLIKEIDYIKNNILEEMTRFMNLEKICNESMNCENDEHKEIAYKFILIGLIRFSIKKLIKMLMHLKE